MRGASDQGWWRSLALVAFRKESKRIDLSNKVCHTSPSSKSEPNNENPSHNERVYSKHSDPAREEERRLLRRILQRKEGEERNKQYKFNLCFTIKS